MKPDQQNWARNFESRVQDLIYNVDAGLGSQLIKIALYGFVVLTIMVMYWLSEFWGLKESEAMDQAQIAEQLQTTGQFNTKFIRPAAVWLHQQNDTDPREIMMSQPDIVHPPLYPWILSKLYFFVSSAVDPTQRVRAYPPEQAAIIPFGNLCTILTGLVLFLMARRFFERRIAVVAASIFFASNVVWANSISGLSIPLATLLATLAIYYTLATIEKLGEQTRPRGWMVSYALAVICCTAAFLTRYSAGWIVVAAALPLSFLIPRHGWKLGLGLIGLMLVLASPWFIRNFIVCGHFFGLTPYLIYNIDANGLTHSFERQVAPVIENLWPAVKAKWAANLAEHGGTALPAAAGSFVAALFVTTYFFRFARPVAHVLRFGLLAGMAGLLLTGCLFGESSIRTLAIFTPVVIIYALSFYYLLIDRMQLAIPLLRNAMIGLVILLPALPLIFKLMPPRSGYPYPPYYLQYIAVVAPMLNEDELMCTDMPWATAWYGKRSSVLVPTTLEDFYKINDMQKRISGIYFTTLTRDLPYTSNLVTGPFNTWYPIFREMIPMDFPLTEAFFLGNRDQLFLTDRPRWSGKR